MNTNSDILKKVNLCEKIELNGNTNSKILLLPILLPFVVGISLLIPLYAYLSISLLFYFSVVALSFLIVLGIRKIIKKTAKAYIKGDTLVVKFAYGTTPKVMNLKSVRSVKTKKMIGYTYTNLNFKMDGISYNVLLFGKPNTNESAESIISIAKQIAA